MRTRKLTLRIVVLLTLPALLLALPATLPVGAQQDVSLPPPLGPEQSEVVSPGGGPDCHGPRVVPPDGTWKAPLTYGEWAAKWVQWAASIPADRNPILDVTGEFAAEGQDGPVWYLAGTFGETGVVRKCSVPRGKALFFPVFNAWYFNCRDENYTVQEMRAALNGFMNMQCVLEVTVDGKPVEDLESFRVSSPAFGVNVPENNIHEAFCNPTQSPAGEYAPVVTEGFYVMLKPFWFPRQHEIYIHGAACDPAGNIMFETEVTYKLTVKGWRP